MNFKTGYCISGNLHNPVLNFIFAVPSFSDSKLYRILLLHEMDDKIKENRKYEQAFMHRL